MEGVEGVDAVRVGLHVGEAKEPEVPCREVDTSRRLRERVLAQRVGGEIRAGQFLTPLKRP